MSITTILYIALAAIFALGFVFFKYFLKLKKRTTVVNMLSILSFISVFTLLLLLINPKVVANEYETVKPRLNILIDESLSIETLDQAPSVREFYQNLINDQELRQSFNIQAYSVGNDFKLLNKDSLYFNQTQTNIYQSLSELSKLEDNDRSAVILISDGNQTYGEDYGYFKANPNTFIFPVIAGDTTSSPDISISNLNVNKYVFLKNQFPVEIILNYTGEQSITSNLKITSGETVLKSQVVEFTKENTSKVIYLDLQAISIGAHLFKVEIDGLKDEKNIANNFQNFAVEVIDERTSVLIVSSFLHPDLGMLKKSIESNQQREATIRLIENIDLSKISDFELIVLYQPNNKFKQLLTEIDKNRNNTLLITGTQTDWNFLNSEGFLFSKSYNSQVQEYAPIYHSNFSQFQFQDIDFSSLPPLEDKFGAMNFANNSYQVLLDKTIEGELSSEPLLFTYTENNQKKAVLLGENIWKWRSQSFLNSGSFEDFDGFLGKTIQYLSSVKNKNRLDLSLESFYKENEEVRFSAQYFDKNYVFDPNGVLILSVINNTSGQKLESEMLLGNSEYIYSTSSLQPGSYKAILKESKSGLVVTKDFIVIEYNIEQQFTKADAFRMKKLASNNDGAFFMIDNFNSLKHQLLQDKRFVSVQKNHEKTVSLINWKLLLALLVLSISAEWFTRKYFGLI